MCLPTVLWNGRCPLATASPTAQLASVGLSGTDLAWWIVGGVLGRLLRTGRVVGVAGVGTLWFGGLDLSDAGFVLVPPIRHRPLRSAGRPGHDHRALRHRASSVLGPRQRLLPPRSGQHRPAPASLAETAPDPPARARVLAQSSGDLLPSCNVKSSYPTTSTPSSRSRPDCSTSSSTTNRSPHRSNGSSPRRSERPTRAHRRPRRRRPHARRITAPTNTSPKFRAQTTKSATRREPRQVV